MKWFRLYSEVVRDPKVQLLPPELFRAWVNLLCIANEGKPRGTLPQVDHIAWHLRLSEDKTASIVEALVRRELLDKSEDGTLTPHNWHGRQPEEEASVARMRKWRQRKRQEQAAAKADSSSDDARLAELRSMPYGDYLCTPEWLAKRKLVLARDGYACCECGARHNLHVHHKTYANRGDEPLEDLTTLCAECHEQHHVSIHHP